MTKRFAYNLVITGASSGIGKYTVLKLAEYSYQVFGLARRYDKLVNIISSERICRSCNKTKYQVEYKSALSVILSTEDFSKFQIDRISFKLYACLQHLKNLKDIELRYNDLASSEVQTTAEIEIDSFLSQMIGTVDCLLFKINDKFGLSIPSDRIEIDKIQSALSAETKSIDLLNDLDRANRYGNWYWTIKQLRNYSLGYSLISQEAFELLANYTKTNMKLIPYFEQSLHYLEKLIETIRIREPILL